VHQRKQQTIVIVEDDAGMRDSLGFLLETHGFDVAAFASPEEFLAGFDGLDAGCVIFDIHLPGTDGLALYERLRMQGRGVPPIFITGRIDDQIRADASDLGAIALLEKPFSDDALLAAVAIALEASRRS